MVSLVQEHLAELKALCEQYKVKRLEVFGSALTGENFDAEKSDVDFLVEFKPLQPGQHADAYFGLLDACKKLFGRGVDLVMVRAIKNPYFLESINKAREVVYAA